MKNENAWYNQKEGIITKLDTLENFFELLEVRRIAHKERDETLNEFYVLNAAFHLDQFGQCGRCLTPQLQQIINLPIITKEELWTIIRNYDRGRNALTNAEIVKDTDAARASGRSYPFQFCIAHEYPPYPGVTCPECGQSWNIKNLTDYLKMESVRKKFPAGEFIGKSLKTMWEAYAKKTDAEYHDPADHRVYNPKHIDNTPHPEYPTLKINRCGFYPDDSGRTDPEYILQEGDVVEFWVIECFHKQCLRTHLDRTEQEGFIEVFKKAGFQKYEFKAIPNEYEGCHDPYCTKCAAWFLVTTEHGIFKVGWRKRVIEITWPKEQKFLQLFTGEDVTKGESGIHAWGWEKAAEYLAKIQQQLVCA